MGEHLLCTQGVRGSNPLVSTLSAKKPLDNTKTIEYTYLYFAYARF